MSFHEKVLSGFVTDHAVISCGYCGVTAIWQDAEGLNYIKSIEDGREDKSEFKAAYFIDELFKEYKYTDAGGIKHNEYTYKISPVWSQLKDRKDIYLVDRLEKCPCCGKPYDDTAVQTNEMWSGLCNKLNIESQITPGYSFGYTPYYEIGRRADEYSRSVRWGAESENTRLVFNECEKNPSEYVVVSEDAVKEISVTDFIKIFIETEAVISSLKERIKYLDIKGSLFAIHSKEELTDIYREAFNKRIGFAIPIGERRKAVVSQFEALNSKAPFNPESVDLSSLSVKDMPEPKKPATPVKPAEPVLQKANLFNKAKVEAENQKIMAQYNADLALYVNLASTYDDRLAKYEKDYAEYLEKHNAYIAAKSEAIAKAKAQFEADKNSPDKALKIAALEESLKEIEKEFEAVPEKALKLALPQGENEYFAAIAEEMEQAKALLKKAYGARSYLKGCGVVHPKYANLGALTSILEYYETGRTDSLTGPNGAYNLYEQALQAQTIINSLDNIANRLESVENAQYSILYTIQDMKENTEKLLTNIADNTARIAYNTAVTAHYTKLNSQLLNSVGMMIALK